MTGKRFYLINGKYVRDNDLIGEKSICLDEAIDTMNALNEENEQLKKENQGIQDKVMRLLDYVELKQCVTRTEIKKWWNGDVE